MEIVVIENHVGGFFKQRFQRDGVGIDTGQGLFKAFNACIYAVRGSLMPQTAKNENARDNDHCNKRIERMHYPSFLQRIFHSGSGIISSIRVVSNATTPHHTLGREQLSDYQPEGEHICPTIHHPPGKKLRALKKSLNKA